MTRLTGVVTFHGPVARASMPAFSRSHFERVLTRAEPPGRLGRIPESPTVLVPQENRIVTLRGGVAEGPLAGGNLTLLQCLIGTPYFPELAGAILFLEDVGEELYRVDRMLAHLRLIGALRRLAGVAVGRFTGLERAGGDGALGFDEVLETYFAPLGIPVAYGFPVGHIDAQWTLPLGIRARLDADAGELELARVGRELIFHPCQIDHGNAHSHETRTARSVWAPSWWTFAPVDEPRRGRRFSCCTGSRASRTGGCSPLWPNALPWPASLL